MDGVKTPTDKDMSDLYAHLVVDQVNDSDRLYMALRGLTKYVRHFGTCKGYDYSESSTCDCGAAQAIGAARVALGAHWREDGAAPSAVAPDAALADDAGASVAELEARVAAAGGDGGE